VAVVAVATAVPVLVLALDAPVLAQVVVAN